MKILLDSQLCVIYEIQYIIYVDKLMFYKKILSDIIKYNLEKDLFFYTYWYDEVTYALQLLKEQYNFKLITRTHRLDLYEERMETGYMPMRRMFIKQID